MDRLAGDTIQETFKTTQDGIDEMDEKGPQHLVTVLSGTSDRNSVFHLLSRNRGWLLSVSRG